MDRLDRLRPALGGVACARCGAAVPSSGLRTAAIGPDRALVDATCPACGETTQVLVLAPDAADDVLEPASPVRPPATAGPRPAAGPSR